MNIFPRSTAPAPRPAQGPSRTSRVAVRPAPFHALAVLVAVGLLVLPAGATLLQDKPPTYKAGVAKVTVGVTVRDAQGRLVTGLGPEDFVVVDSGTAKPITEFQVAERGVSLAAVLDASGSMGIAGRLALAREALDALFAALGEEDEVAFFSFDSELRELLPFTRHTPDLKAAMATVRPFGSTSLYDAVAASARAVSDRSQARRAVLMVTDGLDTSSERTPSQVSGVASSVDVPIYVLGVNPSSRRGRLTEPCDAKRVNLPCVALWTGGQFLHARNSEDARTAMQEVLTELRHQYMIGFDASAEPGWHAIEVRARGGKLVTRTRAWYRVNSAS
jgi:Ca-activated chloride channel homolog